MRTFATLAVAALCLFASCASGPTRWQRERQQWRTDLTRELGRDPIDALAEIGRQPGERAHQLAEALSGSLAERQLLALLRLGLGHDDERVVFAAVLLGRDIPVPEIANAAQIVLPRIGDPDCPVLWPASLWLIGSGDFEVLEQVLPRLPEEDAERFLGALHRMVRPDAVAPLLRLAKASRGEVRKAALSDAYLAVRYSGQHVERFYRAWLDVEGVTVDGTTGSGLHPVLEASLRHVFDSWDPRFDTVLARWLVRSRPTAADLALLQQLATYDRVLEGPGYELRSAAMWAIGSVAGPRTLGMIDGLTSHDLSPAAALAARARAGSRAAVEQLLASVDEGLIYGLVASTAERRRAFCRELLSMPVAEALERIQLLDWWAKGSLAYNEFALPVYDDALMADIEPMLAASTSVSPLVLRALVGALPCCATARLADRLLQVAPEVLFDTEQWSTCEDHLGYRGEWAFLEVTRPDAFRAALRAARASTVDAIRELGDELSQRLDGGPDRAQDAPAEEPQSAERRFADQMSRSLSSGDAPYVTQLLQVVVDGRYATHYWTGRAQFCAAASGLDRLPFWIDQLGSNCCKCVFVDDVLAELFGERSNAFDRSDQLEPAAPFLRRTLLPVAHRLRWSRIADGYVVAGG